MRLINDWKLPKKGKFIGYVIVECTDASKALFTLMVTRCVEMPYDPGNGAAGRRGRDGWRGWVCVLRDGRRLSIRAVVRNEVADMFYAVSHSLTSMCISAFHINASMQIICPPAKVAAPCNLARIRNRFDTCMSNTILFKHHFYKYCLIFFKNLKIY